MGNMSYCRFRNTLLDLKDCADHIEDELSGEEAKARKELLQLCAEISQDYSCDDETEE